MTPTDPDLVPDPTIFTDESPSPEQDGELAIFCDALEEAGIAAVRIYYSGSGDDGSVESVDYEPAERNVPDWLDKSLQDLTEFYCPPGYEINEGGSGYLTIWVGPRLAQLEHTNRVASDIAEQIAPTPLPAPLRRRLRRLKITTLVAGFSGSGDEGAIHGFQTNPPEISLFNRLDYDLEEFLLTLLPGGWELDGGSYGDFSIDVASGEVTTSYFEREEIDDDPVLTHWKIRWQADVEGEPAADNQGASQ